MGFSDRKHRPSDGGVDIVTVPIYEPEYLSLVDTTGRIVVRGKLGRIDPNLKPILSRLNLSTEQWIQVSSGFRQFYRNGHLRLRQAA